MSEDERRRFQARRQAEAAVALRRWDEAGKIPAAATPELAHYTEVVSRLANVGG
jgi:predicted HD phosphohydrolase